MRKALLRKCSRLIGAGAVGLLAVGCASSSGGQTDAGASIGYVNTVADPGDPVVGGTLTVGAYSFPRTFDPTKTQVSGATSGTVLAAVYDTLVRTDPETGDFAPALAESIRNNDDHTVYTVTLHEGTTFSDGSPMDSAAVKWSLDRYVAAGMDQAQVFSDVVAAVDTPDPATVEFRLNKPWDRFPVLLAGGPGMIVAPSSLGAEKFTPIGAGPFTLAEFSPDEKITLSAREDYRNGRPYLDEVVFVPTSGAQQQWESLKSRQIDMTYINRDEMVIGDALASGFPGYLDVLGLGSVGLINQAEGRPGADVRVRKAIAHGVDPVVMVERGNSGLGTADSAIVPEASRWYSGAEGVAFDLETAKTFLAEAKADGYDGNLKFLASPEAAAKNRALAAQAQLNAVGFNVEIDYASDTTDLVKKVYADRDFDMAGGAFQFMDDSPYVRLFSGLGSKSNNNASGYSDARMDELLSAVQTSTDPAAKIQAIAAVQAHANETIPYVVWEPAKVLVAWDSSVHGVRRSADNIILLTSAWIDPS